MFRARETTLMLGMVLLAGTGRVVACVPPERPFLPQSQTDIRFYAELLRGDLQRYFAEVQGYFRCLDEERVRAFQEAREVSEDYRRFITALE